MSEKRERKLVVAGLVHDGARVLISKRLATQSLPLEWEFPGGKVEASESPEVALARELMEEVGIKVQVGRIWDLLFHAYEAFDLYMMVYPCQILEGQPTCLEVADLAWCLPKELANYAILKADAALVARLEREGLPESQSDL